MNVANVVIPILRRRSGRFVSVFQTAWPIISEVATKIGGAFSSVVGVIKRRHQHDHPRVEQPAVHDPVGGPRPAGQRGWVHDRHAEHRLPSRGRHRPRTPGSDVLAMLQAGERVTPAGQAAGNTINLYGDVYGDTIDELSRKIAYRLQFAG